MLTMAGIRNFATLDQCSLPRPMTLLVQDPILGSLSSNLLVWLPADGVGDSEPAVFSRR